jgi:hypothetical protein
MMKGTVGLLAVAMLASACILAGCGKNLQAVPPPLNRDELVIATALRHHIGQHRERSGYDYKYIYLTILGSDPSGEFINYFDDLFPQVLPSSKMNEWRYGYQDLPQTKGIWVHFEVVDYESVSEQEALVSCRTLESEKENPAVTYRMQLLDGQWRAADIIGIERERPLN